METEGINTSQLAKKIGISPQHLSNILNGARSLSIETLKALAQSLGVDVAEIIDDSYNGESSKITVGKDGEFIVEKMSRLRITLPANEESSRLIKELITENEELGNRIQKLLVGAKKETKEKILKLLEKEKIEQI